MPTPSRPQLDPAADVLLARENLERGAAALRAGELPVAIEALRFAYAMTGRAVRELEAREAAA